MRLLSRICSSLSDIADVAIGEFRAIATSYATVLVLIGGIFVYGLLYNYMYEPNLIREAPITIVDKSATQLSGHLSRLIEAAPQVSIYSNAVGFAQAKEQLKKGEVIGIIYIPADFDKRVGRGDQSLFILYAQTDAFLYYLALQEATNGAMMELDQEYRANMTRFLPQQDILPITQTRAVSLVGTALYNPTEGYGTYLIPAVLIVIMFQTLLMVIGMISGHERHSGSIMQFADKGTSMWRMAYIVVGKSFVYCILYAIFALFMVGFLPLLFNLPHIAQAYKIVMLLIPFLLATSFLGLALSVFYTDSETPLLIIAFFSVGLIFLSGVSYPLELMPWYWRTAHYAIPAAPATLAFVKIDSMGASMADIQREYITLWIQCLIFFPLACLAYRHNITKQSRKTSLKG